MEYFHGQHTLFAMSDKRKYKKSLQRRKAWNKSTKTFPNKWKRKLAKSDKGMGNGSMNMNMKKGGFTINITMMTLI